MTAKEEDEQTMDASDGSNGESLRDLLNNHRRQRFDDNEAHIFVVVIAPEIDRLLILLVEH